ncbi:MAG: hypothetical protein ACK4M6_08275 [Hyphomonas sp.]
MTYIIWKQHAVGHGGFHTGKLFEDGELAFSWAFDCGSKSTAKFEKYLSVWSQRNSKRLNWLFVSHFDLDHVSGLNALMSCTQVQNVMVPYVDNKELILVLLREINRGRLDQTIIELTADPAFFFLSRGADRIVFLGSGGGEGPDVFDTDKLDGDDRPSRDGDVKVKIKPTPSRYRASSLISSTLSEPNVELIDSDSCDIEVSRSAGFMLSLKPYRMPINAKEDADIVSELEKLVGVSPSQSQQSGLGSLSYAIAKYACDPTGRAKLREIYKRRVGSSNRSSLSLLSVPVLSSSTNLHWCFAQGTKWSEGWEFAPGWINTGDAELLKRADLDEWTKSYSSYLAQVKSLALPHHGSDKNSDHEFQKLCTHAHFIAHVKSGAGKHPGGSVTASAAGRLCCVTEDRATAAHMWLRC